MTKASAANARPARVGRMYTRLVTMLTGSRSSPWRRRAQDAKARRSVALREPLKCTPRAFAYLHRNRHAAAELGDERCVVGGGGDAGALETMPGYRREHRLHVFG